MKIFRAPIIRNLLMLWYRVWRWFDGNLQRYIFNNISVWGTKTLAIGTLNIKMYSHGDDSIVDAIYFTGSQYGEHEEINLFQALSTHASVILDIGSNTGLYSIVSQLKNPQARVFAFEPYIINMNRLQRNAALNGLSDKIQFVEIALGDSEATVDFAVPQSDRISDVLSADTDFTEQFSTHENHFTTEKIKQVSLDTFVKEQQLESVDLMKIDVENYELSVLRGSLEVLNNHRPVMLIEVFVDAERSAFFDEHLAPLGYSCFMIGIKGLHKTDGLQANPDFRNFLLCPAKFDDSYLSFSEMDSWLPQLVEKPNTVHD